MRKVLTLAYMSQFEMDIDLSDLDLPAPRKAKHRKSPRAELFARIELPYHASRAIRARDISLSGIRALTRDGRIAHLAGERLHLRFRLPGATQTIEATARVVSQRDAGNDVCVGLRFETLTSQAAVQIYRFVADRAA